MPRRRRSGWLPGPWGYVLNRAVAPLFPLGLAHRLSLPIADVVYVLWRSKRENARRNYAHILGRSPDDPLVEGMVRSCFRHFGRYVAEMLHVQGWDTESVVDRLEVRGGEHFDEAKALGRGVIFVSAHLGSTEIAASLAVLRGYKITSVAQPLHPRFVMDWIVACRADMGVTLLPTTGTGIALVRALRRREMVALVVDAGVDIGGGIPVRFFGRTTLFPSGPARLARLSGAPIVFGLGARRPGGRFIAHVEPPLLSNRELDAEEDGRVLTQRVAGMFEGYVRRYPDQWYAFRPMWPEDDGQMGT